MNTWTKAFLVALRIAVGWHFLYEGLYKIDSDSGSTSYSTARYALQASTGRLRDYFNRAEPGSLKLKPSLARIDAWHDEIVRAFAAQRALGEDQKSRLGALRDQVKLNAISAIRGNLAPEDIVNFDWTYVHEDTLKVPPAPEAERFTALGYLQASAGPFRGLYRALVPDMDGLERLTVAGAQARIDARYREILNFYADHGTPFTTDQQKRLAAARDAIKASIAETLNSPAFQARLADYRQFRKRVAEDPASLHAPFTRERLDANRKNLDVIAGEMLGFVNEPISELAVQTQAIATVAQLGAGPLPRPRDPSAFADRAIKISLTAIGACLLLGFFTPVAAVAAAAQLAMFYFASPPWPGLPAASTAGHYLYIDRNFIEMLAAFVIATTGTGRLAGLDAYLEKYVLARFHRHETPQPAPAVALNS